MFALVDCNNFYVSCERIFDPTILYKPVVVLSNNDGCVISRSNEAKKIGIKMGVPFFKIQNQVMKHDISVFSSNYTLYGDLSFRVFNTLKTEFNSVEIYSIDEAFLSYDLKDFESRASRTAKKIKKWTGIPVSIGLAPNKVLSKIANQVVKKRKDREVYLLKNQQEIDRILANMPVEELWGIGRRITIFLKKYGIHTALQFKQTNSQWLKSNLNINALRIKKELFGEVCFPLEENNSMKKNICTSRSFSKTVSSLDKLKSAIGSYANVCSLKLRKQKSCATSISVFMLTNRFDKRNKFQSLYQKIILDTPTNDSLQIVKQSLILLESIYKPGLEYKKVGVVVSSIVPDSQVQMSLFNKIDFNKRRSLNKTIDKVNYSMGKDLIRFAVQENGKNWMTNRKKLSPCYTTSFKDMLTISL